MGELGEELGGEKSGLELLARKMLSVRDTRTRHRTGEHQPLVSGIYRERRAADTST